MLLPLCLSCIWIDPHRDCLVGTPKTSQDHTRMDIKDDEQRGTCVPGVMNSDATNSRGLAERDEFHLREALGCRNDR